MDEERVREIVRAMVFSNGKQDMAIEEIAKIQPGLGRLMPEIGHRTWKLFYAAEALNWPNALYQWKETRKLFEIGILTRPKHAAAMEEYLRVSWAPLGAAIEDESWGSFRRAFRAAVGAANAWHVKTHKPYIRWKLPDHPPPDLDLKPR
ncbi:MAG: hypothetical protein OEM05_03285 [Myxococcales bacterium]|nr:hypothetical protein [Myxococcales bacterium]